jgi:Domain of Unknown Function (DUF1080)
MLRHLVSASLVFVSFTVLRAADEPQQLFNEKDLSGWEGDPAVWSVEHGAIVGHTTADAPIKNNTFLIWKDGELGDFRLRLEYRIDGGNSGVQYRSKVIDPEKWIVGGYQADIDSEPVYTGILYDEQGRGILANRGERVTIDRDGKRAAQKFADAAELMKSVKTDGWNEYVIEAVGPRLRHTINGKLMSETVDNDAEKQVASGILALQVHQGPPMTVRFRKIELETLNAETASSSLP